MFGERLGWSLKEMWVNVLDTGGRQAMHNHANSFISGVVYLTRTHPEARTVFMKSPGGTDFSFKNDHAGVATGPYNADKWISMPPEPGDVVLFPSYLMHAVPRESRRAAHHAGVQRHPDARSIRGATRFLSAADVTSRALAAISACCADAGIGLRRARPIRSSGRSRVRCGSATNQLQCWR